MSPGAFDYINTPPYSDVLEELAAALKLSEGVLKLTGLEGCGKTTLCNCLDRYLRDNKYRVVFFTRPPDSVDILQNTLLDALQLPGDRYFTRTLTQHLLADPEQLPLVVIIDDAQEMDYLTFSAIRMLCNIQDHSRELVRIILSGNERLNQKLNSASYRSLAQHIGYSAVLEHMTEAQALEFVHRCWIARHGEASPPPQTELQQWFRQSQGKSEQLAALVNAVVPPVASSVIEPEFPSPILLAAQEQLVQEDASKNIAPSVIEDLSPVATASTEVGNQLPDAPDLPADSIVISAPVSVSETILENPEAIVTDDTEVDHGSFAGKWLAVAGLMTGNGSTRTIALSVLGFIVVVVAWFSMPDEQGVSSPLPALDSTAIEQVEPVDFSPVEIVPEAAFEPDAELTESDPELSGNSPPGLEPERPPEPAPEESIASTDVLPKSVDPAPANMSEPLVVAVAVAEPEPEPALEPEPVDPVMEVVMAEPELIADPPASLPLVAEESITSSNSDMLTATAILESWISVWEQRNVEGYLAYYADDFQPAYADTLSEWQLQLERNISAATELSIRYTDLEVSGVNTNGLGQLRLQFWLEYRSATYSDDSLKELILVEADTGWKIISERNLELKIIF